MIKAGDNRPAPSLPVTTVVVPVPQFSTPIVHRKLSSLDAIHPQMVQWLTIRQFPNNGGGACRLAFGSIPKVFVET